MASYFSFFDDEKKEKEKERGRVSKKGEVVKERMEKIRVNIAKVGVKITSLSV